MENETRGRHLIVQRWLAGETDAGGCISELEQALIRADMELVMWTGAREHMRVKDERIQALEAELKATQVARDENLAAYQQLKNWNKS